MVRSVDITAVGRLELLIRLVVWTGTVEERSVLLLRLVVCSSTVTVVGWLELLTWLELLARLLVTVDVVGRLELLVWLVVRTGTVVERAVLLLWLELLTRTLVLVVPCVTTLLVEREPLVVRAMLLN